jgi:hypothetical protein
MFTFLQVRTQAEVEAAAEKSDETKGRMVCGGVAAFLGCLLMLATGEYGTSCSELYEAVVCVDLPLSAAPHVLSIVIKFCLRGNAQEE